MATKSGGGINSRNVKSVGVKTGQPRRGSFAKRNKPDWE